ncbi:class I SAM-dependent methyltransferase [Candidatus Woesearchaeota archaeon]|nr:class I SAM-dependent methyltransferase [Candidatus Woesearchaeota archaeon]
MGYYNGISKGYAELYGDEQLEKAKAIAKLIQPKKNEKLLDVGCGDGAYLHLFNCDITGVDTSSELLKIAKKNNPKAGFVLAKAEELPFKENSFDFVISVTAVHNFDDIENGLKEMERVAKSKVVLSILKRSPKFSSIQGYIEDIFEVEKKIELEKDVVFVLEKIF